MVALGSFILCRHNVRFRKEDDLEHIQEKIRNDAVINKIVTLLMCMF